MGSPRRLLSSLSSLALDEATTTLTQGAFNLGFALDCVHDVEVNVLDDTVLCVINPPKKNKSGKVKLKIKAKKPGSTSIFVTWSSSQSGCSGSASASAIIEVTPNLGLTVKEVKLISKTAISDIKKKFKDGTKWFCGRLKQLESALKKGEITITQFNQLIEDAIGGVGFGLSLSLAGCLKGMSESMGDALIEAGLNEYLSEVQDGSCKSLVTDGLSSAQAGWVKFASMLKSKSDKVIKKVQKKSPGPMIHTTSKISSTALGLDAVPPPSVDGDLPSGPSLPVKFLGAYGWNDNDSYAGLRVMGTADPSMGDVQVKIVSRMGTVFNDMVMTRSLSQFYADTDLGDDPPPFDAENLNQMGVFSLSIGVGFSPGDGGAQLEPGPLRIELSYPGDVNPAEVIHFSLP